MNKQEAFRKWREEWPNESEESDATAFFAGFDAGVNAQIAAQLESADTKRQPVTIGYLQGGAWRIACDTIRAQNNAPKMSGDQCADFAEKHCLHFDPDTGALIRGGRGNVYLMATKGPEKFRQSFRTIRGLKTAIRLLHREGFTCRLIYS